MTGRVPRNLYLSGFSVELAVCMPSLSKCFLCGGNSFPAFVVKPHLLQATVSIHSLSCCVSITFLRNHFGQISTPYHSTKYLNGSGRSPAPLEPIRRRGQEGTEWEGFLNCQVRSTLMVNGSHELSPLSQRNRVSVPGVE